MVGLWGDLKLGLSLLGKRPGLSALIVTLLAVSVAGNAAMFSLFNGLFLTPLPFSKPDRLVHLDEAAPEWGRDRVSVSYPDFDAWRADNRTFEAIAVYRSDSYNLASAGTGAPRRVKVARVSHDLPHVLRVELLSGRPFAPQEDRPGGAKVALVSAALWRDYFGGSLEVPGTVVFLHGEPTTVIGVLPQSAEILEDADLWIPLATDVDENPDAWYLRGIGRLKEGVTVDEAQIDLARAHERVGTALPLHAKTVPVVVPLVDRFVGEYRQGTLALGAAVALVLLLTCANVSGLMLVGAASRKREIGVRLALGASRKRLVRQLLIESLILASAGGILGAALGTAAVNLAVARLPEVIPRWVRYDLDLRLLAFSALVILAATVTSGLVPALSAARTDMHHALRLSTGGGTHSRGSRRHLSLLVTVEVALATTLLVATTLVASSFREVLLVEPGYHLDGVLTYRITFPESRYPDSDDRRRFIDEHLEDLRGSAGVIDTGAVNTAPLGPHEGTLIEIDGDQPVDESAPSPAVLTRIATPDYFRAMGVVMMIGDVPHADVEVAVNASFVERYWPGAEPGDAIGRRLRARGTDEWLTVVGVTNDVRHYGLASETRAGIYLPHQRFTPRVMTFVIRARGEPSMLVQTARASVARLDRELPTYASRTMRERVAVSLWPQRAGSWLVSGFSVFALILALTGIYGVTSHAARERDRELGIRTALGAQRPELLQLIVREGMRPVLIGTILGVFASLAASQTLSAFLFEVSASDVRVHASVAFALAAAALPASVAPAARAIRSDPMSVLRGD